MSYLNKLQPAIDILAKELKLSRHYTKYPQDRYKDEMNPRPIAVLITTAEYHKNNVIILLEAIELLETVRLKLG
jgi:hypothetical protein